MVLIEGDYDEPQMMGLAMQLARQLRAGDCLTFQGDLGAGKTTFIRAMIHTLCGLETVPSPTFTLVQTYDSSLAQLWHFDLYRLKNPDELYELGFEEALSGGILFIEWPERAKGLLPSTQLQLHLENAQDNSKRKVTISGDAQWAARLTPLNQH
ncbi:MAG: tRNA (adenosine(37)-N6)-threonylcarbamoyltransferase complex ATPase subunit type 1 TsaE [Alphaproteobacteria bacterium]|nr:tRNA (adenosine(37)-N6)-threonylcarbamoyltransferase complex ATPase subunit type 1 TsaE [Alphaproteobacteria bacterium]